MNDCQCRLSGPLQSTNNTRITGKKRPNLPMYKPLLTSDDRVFIAFPNAKGKISAPTTCELVPRAKSSVVGVKMRIGIGS